MYKEDLNHNRIDLVEAFCKRTQETSQVRCENMIKMFAKRKALIYHLWVHLGSVAQLVRAGDS